MVQQPLVTNPALFMDQNLISSHFSRSFHPSVNVVDNLADAARILSGCSLRNPFETLDADEAVENIDQILNAVNCLNSLMRLSDDVYRNISSARNIPKNISRRSARTPRVNTSIRGRPSYDIRQEQLQS